MPRRRIPLHPAVFAGFTATLHGAVDFRVRSVPCGIPFRGKLG